MFSEPSPETVTALQALAQAAGGELIRIITPRICDMCQNADKEAFPVYAADRLGRTWDHLCADCSDLLGIGETEEDDDQGTHREHWEHCTCDACGQPFTLKEWDERETPHHVDCPNYDPFDEDGDELELVECDCDRNYHARCFGFDHDPELAEPAKPYRIYNRDAADLTGAHVPPFASQDDAAFFILATLPHDRFPFYVADESGNLLELVYAGTRWKDESVLRKRVDQAIALAKSTKEKLTAHPYPYTRSAAKVACVVLDDVLDALGSGEVAA